MYKRTFKHFLICSAPIGLIFLAIIVPVAAKVIIG